MDEAPAENRMNNIIQKKISTTNNVAQLQDENQCRGAMDVTPQLYHIIILAS
jgi:hypothetical protein